MRSKLNFPDFISTVNKLYLPEDAMELDKLKSTELYEEAVVNCFIVWLISIVLYGLELVVGIRRSSFDQREQLKELRSDHNKLLTEKGETNRELIKLKISGSRKRDG